MLLFGVVALYIVSLAVCLWFARHAVAEAADQRRPRCPGCALAAPSYNLNDLTEIGRVRWRGEWIVIPTTWYRCEAQPEAFVWHSSADSYSVGRPWAW